MSSSEKETELKVRSLIIRARSLPGVERIICVGVGSHRSIIQHAALIKSELAIPANAIKRIPRYSFANSGEHKRYLERYRALTHDAIGIA